MSLKKTLMVGVLGSTLLIFSPRQAFAYRCKYGFCFFGDIISAVAAYVLNESEQKLLNPVYDVHEGLEAIKKNIGMYQDQGICGRSATGATGCDLVSEEEGAAMAAGLTGTDVSTMMEGASAMMNLDVTGLLAEKVEANGDIKLNQKDFNEDYIKALGLSDGADTFDRVRANVVAHVFETDIETVNKSCTCTVTQEDGSCDISECARQRQDELLTVSSTGASASSDEYVREMGNKYSELKGFVEEINGGSKTVADFIGNMGFLSVYASTAAIEQMAVLTYDLRTQSYRNLVFSGTKEEDLSQLGGGN